MDYNNLARQPESDEHCTVCGKVVKVMCQRGTGLCSRNCEKLADGEKVIPVASGV